MTQDLAATQPVRAEFTIERQPNVPGTAMLGQLLIEGIHSCYTLELPWANNAPGKSCIPVGRYRCVSAWSSRFARRMPRLLDVPGRTGILLHPGNTEANTEGCVLLGSAIGDGETLVNSKIAFEQFTEWLASVGDSAMCEVSQVVLL